MNQLQSIKKIIKSEFFRASFWVFLATGVINVGNYAYHLLMGRMLGPENYGILESAISFLYIISVPFMTLTLIIVKFVSSYRGKQDKKSTSAIFYYLRNKLFVYGLISTVILLLFSPLIISLLHLPNIFFPVFIALNFFIGLFSVLTKGTLQGLFKFFELFVINFVEILGKLLIAVVLVFIGFKALGAFFAFVGSIFLGLLVAVYFIKREKFLNVERFIEHREIFKYSIPVFITTLGLTSLFTTDIILVRNLFSGLESGYYAALSILGKMIFFATFPITTVLFPLISERHAGGKNYRNLLFIGILLTLAISIIIVLIYYLAPKVMIGLLFGQEYLSIVPFLGTFGVFIAIYSLCTIISNFYLSIHKTIASFFVLASGILQIILILVFHQNLLQVIHVSVFTTTLLLISLIAYYPFATKEKIKS